jgi:hypothetical protein
MAEEVRKLTQKFESIYAQIEINRKVYETKHFFKESDYYLDIDGQIFSVNGEMTKCKNLPQLKTNIDDYVFSIFNALKNYTQDYANTSFSQIDSKAKAAHIWINNLDNSNELEKISKSQIEAPVINICWEGLHDYVDNFSDAISQKIFTLFQQK